MYVDTFCRFQNIYQTVLLQDNLDHLRCLDYPQEVIFCYKYSSDSRPKLADDQWHA